MSNAVAVAVAVVVVVVVVEVKYLTSCDLKVDLEKKEKVHHVNP